MSAEPMTHLQFQDASQGILGSQEAWADKRKVEWLGCHLGNIYMFNDLWFPEVIVRLMSNLHYSLVWGITHLNQYHFKSLVTVTLPVRGSKDHRWAGWYQGVIDGLSIISWRMENSLKLYLLINSFKIPSTISMIWYWIQSIFTKKRWTGAGGWILQLQTKS